MITIEEGYSRNDHEALRARERAWDMLTKEQQAEEVALDRDFMQSLREDLYVNPSNRR